MKKLTFALMLASALALPYSAFAVDPDAPIEQNPTPSATPNAPPSDPGAKGRSATSMFDQLDTNKDGYIDRTETARSATVRANFDSLDLDGDGRISRSEWEAFEASSARG